MISGRVSDDGKEATLAVSVRGPGGRTLNVEAVIDTGFNDALSLRPQEIDDLGLAWVGRFVATMADNTQTPADVYAGEVIWDNQPRRVSITEIPTNPLIGMSLMADYRLTIDVIPDGNLQLEKIDSTNHN